jgi:signal transduction histidine kinase
MRTLPLIARCYLAIICLSAAGIAAALLPLSGLVQERLILMLACLVVMVLAEYAEVSLEVREGHKIHLTVGEAVAIFAISTIGPTGFFVVAISAAVDSLRRRRSWERVIFNASMLAITYCFAALVYAALQPAGRTPYGGPSGLLTFFGVAGTYYGANSLLVSLMVALASGQPALRIYRESLQQTTWVHLLTFTVGAAMAALYTVDPWLVIYGVLILLVARYTFATVAALSRETRKRQELAEERARLYEELHRQQEELTRASKLAALGTLSAGIAHEFNNMLTAILGHAQIGEMADSFVEKDYSLGVISRVCQRATGITASLLTFARQREPDLSPNLLQTAIDETLDLVRPDLERAQISLVTAIDDLPLIMCDLGQIGQVLLNLITNARDALQGRDGAEIRLALSEADGQALLTIADNGPGIPPEVLDKMFQPFITTKKKGNGLGMAICYGIIESHRGRISIDSGPERGTTITIGLPLHTGESLSEPGKALAEVAA